LQVFLELGNLLSQHVWSVADAADDTQAASIGDGGGKLGAGSDVHAGEENGVVDLEQISDGGTDLLCSVASVSNRALGSGGERDERGEAIVTAEERDNKVEGDSKKDPS
jgi:hypothetical protein